ncbi:hypothetical protein F0344_00275 [Streptomyces finlayi]|uniref:CBM2 domain-containing protein n=1 Tax=Streptomyces finlayi TaxID=67296 RepID=A0A7G7BD58_9ACTN|nr:cellulose binding domain-containing protein [Streptomyces finlayi]QNE73273.1 hypothetical protein F0344_00275 [Streptomyces finlayi]
MAGSPATSRALAWSFAGGQVIQTMWGGTASRTGGDVTVIPADYTRVLPAGGSVTVGFVAGGTGGNPTAFPSTDRPARWAEPATPEEDLS